MWITKFATLWVWERILYSFGLFWDVSVPLLSSSSCVMIGTYGGGANCCGLGMGDMGVGTVGDVGIGSMDMLLSSLLSF